MALAEAEVWGALPLRQFGVVRPGPEEQETPVQCDPLARGRAAPRGMR